MRKSLIFKGSGLDSDVFALVDCGFFGVSLVALPLPLVDLLALFALADGLVLYVIRKSSKKK